MYTKLSVFLGCISSVLAAATAAYAKPYSIESYIIAASSQNSASVTGNFSNASGVSTVGERYITSTTIAMSFNGSAGVAQESQNSGANSASQNAISLAYISTCAACLKADALGVAATVGAASNAAQVGSNLDFPGYGSTNSSSGGGNSGGSGGTTGNTPGGNGLTPQGSDPFATITGSFNQDVGVFSTNQNAGDNSLLQNSVAVGVIKMAADNIGTSMSSTAKNLGVSHQNVSYVYFTSTSSNVDGSFDHSLGSLVLNQNSASNSLMQNAITITYSNVKPATSDLLEMTAAKVGNTALLTDNFASSQLQANPSLMSNSFNSSTGVLVSSQNSGANSIVQNAVSVAAITGN